MPKMVVLKSFRCRSSEDLLKPHFWKNDIILNTGTDAICSFWHKESPLFHSKSSKIVSVITKTIFSNKKFNRPANIARTTIGYPSHISTDIASPGAPLWCSFDPAVDESSLGGSVVIWGIWCLTVPSRSVTSRVVCWLRPWWLAVTWVVAPLCRMKLGGFRWFRCPKDGTVDVWVSVRTPIRSSVWPVVRVSPVWDSI